MRTIIVGDIHGCLREFELLLEKVQFQVGVDRLILVGDLINKGPHSLGVLQKAYDLRAQVVIGNHELALLTGHSAARFPRELMAWIKTWPAFIEEKDFIVVHGGIVPGQELSQTPIEQLSKIRLWDEKPWFEFYHEQKLVVFGHWAAKGLVWRDNVIGLDTGCVYGKQLSCVVLPGRQLVQVNALNQYAPIVSKSINR